jgi:hypothetical protein
MVSGRSALMNSKFLFIALNLFVETCNALLRVLFAHLSTNEAIPCLQQISALLNSLSEKLVVTYVLVRVALQFLELNLLLQVDILSCIPLLNEPSAQILPNQLVSS